MQLGWPKESLCNEGATEPLLAINNIKELGYVSVYKVININKFGAHSLKRLVHLPTNCSHCLHVICYLLNVGTVSNEKGHTVLTNPSGLLVCRGVNFTCPINPITRSLPLEIDRQSDWGKSGSDINRPCDIREWRRRKVERIPLWASFQTDRRPDGLWNSLRSNSDDDDFSEINDAIDTLNFQEKLRNWAKRIQQGTAGKRRNWTDN